MKTTIKNGHLVQRKAGTKIPAAAAAALKKVSDELYLKGYIVLDSSWAKMPSHMTFFTHLYRPELNGQRKFADLDLPAPMGVVQVQMIRDGRVVVNVMGTGWDEKTIVATDINWL